MFKNYLTIFMLFFWSETFCQTGVNIDSAKTITPKLLWQKEFEIPIRTLKVNSDSTRIALTVEPTFRDVKDSQYEYGTKREFYGGKSKLYYLDNNGNTLWEYEHKKSTGTYSFGMIMSDDGKYIACRVWEWITGTYENSDMKTQDWVSHEILFFNSDGKLLWSNNESSFGVLYGISLDGKLLTGIYKYGNEYPTIFDQKGYKMWESLIVLKYEYGEDGYYEGLVDIIANAKYVVAGDTVYDINKNIIWKCEEGFFIKVSPDGRFGIVLVPASLYLNTYKYKKLLCIDLFNKKVMWEESLLGLKFPDLWDSCAISNNYFIYCQGKVTYLYALVTKKILFEWPDLKAYAYEFNDERNITFWNSRGLWYYNLLRNELKQVIKWPVIELKNKIVARDGKFMVGAKDKTLYFYDTSRYGK